MGPVSALLVLAAGETGKHQTAPPGLGTGIPLIIGVLILVFLAGLALYLLIVHGRAQPPARTPEPRRETEARFLRADSPENPIDADRLKAGDHLR